MNADIGRIVAAAWGDAQIVTIQHLADLEAADQVSTAAALLAEVVVDDLGVCDALAELAGEAWIAPERQETLADRVRGALCVWDDAVLAAQAAAVAS